METKYAAVEAYKDMLRKNLTYNFPTLSKNELDYAIDHLVEKYLKRSECVINNNYTNLKVQSNLLDTSQFIHDKTPIIASNGCLFKQHTAEPTPVYKLITSFTEDRNAYKKDMFKYDKGTEKFNHYNMLQQLAKRDNNAFYGVAGNYSSALYNLYIAVGITRTGRALISHAITFFESFFTNNVKFTSMDEAITFIDRVDNEPSIMNPLDKDIDAVDVFYKIMSTFDRDYFADDLQDEMVVIWNILLNKSQTTLNKLFYKNNALQFCNDSSYFRDLVASALSDLGDDAFIDPNNPPESIIKTLDLMFLILKEWCYMRYIVLDKISRSATMHRDISIITDTDSTMPCFNGWYEFVTREIVPNSPYEIKLDKLPEKEKCMVEDRVYDYKTDSIVTKMIDISTSDSKTELQYSVINILSYIAGRLLREHFDLVSENYNTKSEYKKCLISMKNEFLFGRALLTGGKKNYASKQLLQEGNIVPPNKMLDVKGLPMNKSGLKSSTRKQLKEILFNKILNVREVNQLDVIASIERIKYDILESIKSGSKEYYKPVTIKSYDNYKNPMGTQGIKGAVAYNAIRDRDMEPIDLTKRNSVDIVKVGIDKSNIEKIMYTYPETYTKILDLLDNDKDFKGTITALSIPADVDVPEWLLEFVDSDSIINDNLKTFPLESIGITKFGKDKVNYSNVITF